MWMTQTMRLKHTRRPRTTSMALEHPDDVSPPWKYNASCHIKQLRNSLSSVTESLKCQRRLKIPQIQIKVSGRSHWVDQNGLLPVAE